MIIKTGIIEQNQSSTCTPEDKDDIEKGAAAVSRLLQPLWSYGQF